MRNLTIFWFIVLSLNRLLISNTLDHSIISGAVHNCKNPTIFINQQSVFLDSIGQFKFTIDLAKPAYFEIKYGQRFYLYLHPKEQIHLEIDAQQDIRTTKLKGDQLNINQHLIREEYESQKMSVYFNENFRDIVTLEENFYVQKMKQIWSPFETRFEKFVGDGQIQF